VARAPRSNSKAGDPLRVACCFGTFPPDRNGGADFLARFAGALAKAGAEVTVLTARGHAPEVERPTPGVEVHRTVDDWGIGAAGRRALRRANRLLAERRVEIVHVFFPDPGLGGRYQLPAYLGLGRLPLVTTFWNLGLGRRSPMPLRLAALALLARSRAVTSHDPGYLSTLRLLAPHRPVRWLPVGNNVGGAESSEERAAVRVRFGLDPNARYLAYFGQLDFTRGLDDLFEALALARRSTDVRLVMVGSAAREERYAADPDAHREYLRLRALPGALGVEDAVEWTGYLPDSEVAALLRACDLCVLPYRRNSLGRSALAAALDLGVPTVLAGTPRGVAPLRPGRHVALVPAARPEELAATVADLLSRPHELELLAAGARRAARFFDWPRIAATALGLYRQVLEVR